MFNLEFRLFLIFIQIDIGTIPIPKSASKTRIAKNIQIFDFKLTPEEIVEIDKLDSGLRICPAEE